MAGKPFMPVDDMVRVVGEGSVDYADGDDPGYFRIHWNPDASELILGYEPDESADPQYRRTEHVFRYGAQARVGALSLGETAYANAQKFRKRPVVFEAFQWRGDNEAEIQEWAGGARWFNALDDEDRVNCGDPDATAQVFDRLHSTWVLVFTGQWIVRGVKGEFHPIADDVLKETADHIQGES